jgi:ABC-type multidrug transport system ATPase subunit
MLGFSRKEIDAMYEEIVEFAELEDFMELQLKNYSSGMKVRLAFSVAVRAQADILILDEVLAVGDTAFKRKCYDYFKNLKEAHKTIVLVSHSMSLIRRYCDRAILIEDGKIAHQGDAESVANEYSELFSMDSSTASQSEDSFIDMLEYTGKVIKDKIHINLKLSSNKTIKNLVLVIRILGEQRTVAGVTSEHLGLSKGLEIKKGTPTNLQIVLDNTIRRKNFYVSFSLRNKDASVRYGHWDRILQLENNTEPSRLPVIMSGNIKIKP